MTTVGSTFGGTQSERISPAEVGRSDAQLEGGCSVRVHRSGSGDEISYEARLLVEASVGI